MAELRVTQVGSYAEAEGTSIRVTQFGSYAEAEGTSIRVTQFGAYAELVRNEIRITQVGAYVELEELGYTPVGRIEYDEVDITEYVSQARLESLVSIWDTTHFGSTARESAAGIPRWRLALSGHWDATWDSTMMPDVVSYNSSRRSVSVRFVQHGQSTGVRYTWDASAGTGQSGAIRTMGVRGEIGDALRWEAELLLSNAPTRTVE